MRVARGSIGIQKILIARRLPRRAWQLCKTLGGASRAALIAFFENDGQYFHLRNYFLGGSSCLGRRAWRLWETLSGANRTALKEFFENDDHYIYLRNCFLSGPSWPVSGMAAFETCIRGPRHA